MAAGVDGGHMTSVTVLRSTVAEKNKLVIMEELKKIIPDGSHVLEIASGIHVVAVVVMMMMTTTMMILKFTLIYPNF